MYRKCSSFKDLLSFRYLPTQAQGGYVLAYLKLRRILVS